MKYIIDSILYFEKSFSGEIKYFINDFLIMEFITLLLFNKYMNNSI